MLSFRANFHPFCSRKPPGVSVGQLQAGSDGMSTSPRATGISLADLLDTLLSTEARCPANSCRMCTCARAVHFLSRLLAFQRFKEEIQIPRAAYAVRRKCAHLRAPLLFLLAKTSRLIFVRWTCVLSRFRVHNQLSACTCSVSSPGRCCTVNPSSRVIFGVTC